ncbi:hypothetical protein [Nocardiopsis sp. NPDC058789]|uniref:hypothetical protein n=1 Tax=Nocardiopsis sp. NPDC058789 TaxID=3346634 RepID=UPI003671C392
MEPTVPAAAHTIAARHHVPPEQVHPLPPGGAHHVLALGPDLVLRLPRTPDDADSPHTEAALIPLARRAGVRTPDLVTTTQIGHQLAPHPQRPHDRPARALAGPRTTPPVRAALTPG